MKKKLASLVMSVLCVALLSGCVTTLGESGEVHDELFTYEMTYDRAYLYIIEAFDQIPEWDIEETGMPDGLITARATGMDGEKVILRVKSTGKRQITLEIAKVSQKTRGAGKLLQKLDTILLGHTE